MSGLRRQDLDARRFPAETLDRLVAAIDVNDRIDLDAPLPAFGPLHHARERSIDGFALSRQLWRERFDAPGLIALATTLRRGETMDETARRWFKQVRAAFKHLRFACFLYSAAHRAPPGLSLVTLELGEVQDAIRVGDMRAVRRHATALRLLLTGPARLLLHRETDRLRPSDADALAAFTRAQVASLRPALAAERVGAHAFHAARKVVSRQVSLHDDMRTLYPDDPQHARHRAAARWLATLNGLMGRLHDELVASHAAGRFDYVRDTLVLPDAIAARLGALVDGHLGTSSS